MKSVKETIGKVIFPNLERFVTLAYEGGDNPMFLGYPCYSDDEKYLMGTLAEQSINLLIHYSETGDTDMAEKSIVKLNYFLDIISRSFMESWGKFAILKGLVKLQKNGLLAAVDEKYIDILKEKTDYDDIIYKDTVELKGFNTNYYHVAMACAGLRHMLGWEDAVMRDKIAEKLYSAMSGYSSRGWMDENFPNGRFDRYSIVIASEIADTLHRLGMEVPGHILDYLKMSADAALKMINARGDGICYGRSLSTHGDAMVSEIISTALICGLIDEKDIDKAMWYTIRTFNKILDFWYDKKRESFNVWFDGRTTNGYRHLQRILELNLDMFGGHLLNTYENFETAGYADYVPDFEYISPDKWSVEEIVFDEREYVRKTFILKRREHMFTLPLIGCGDYIHWASYLSFPISCGLVEAPPELYMPYLTPLVEFKDGSTAMPVQYFDKIDVADGDDRIEIKVHVKTLACADERNPSPVEGTECEITYIFDQNSIGANYEIKSEKEIKNITMQFAYSGDLKASAEGMDVTEIRDVKGNKDYFTTHGGCDKLICWNTESNTNIGYKIEF